MSDIRNLESRITSALDRIRQGLDAKNAATPANGAEVEALQAALEKERGANSELIERVRLLKDRQDTQVADLTNRVDAQRSQMLKLDSEMQQLRASNIQLREMNAKLRAAVTNGLGPELLNDATEAEIAAMKAERAVEAAEIAAIISELKPLIAETSDATG